VCGGRHTHAPPTHSSHSFHRVQAGGRRIDSADTYDNDAYVGAGIAAAGVPRDQLFFLSKTGSGQAMGYNDTMTQFQGVLDRTGLTYVDALLIHWPTSTAPSTDPHCNTGAGYNATACRLHTWAAMLAILDSGRARAVGVSNYNATHLDEIRAAGEPTRGGGGACSALAVLVLRVRRRAIAGMRLPALNQIPFNVYRSSSHATTTAYCHAHGIVINAYSPLGAPDYHSFPAPMAASPLVDPAVTAVAQAHGKTPAQVLIAWLWALGIPTNPRTRNTTHMADNLQSYGFTLSQREVDTLSSLPQDACGVDGGFYECDHGWGR